ncbi:2,3,4,5-tetrahydropyridine-2,6-carboxylate N-succinyltransferase [Pseudorhodobacter sp. E13]|uniref:choice-of-anchor L domain-containing protein n=1 Tax=Pseudorhodobacter sp. E13 TaxID=2487931 RepID=UPI000F8D0428|nr:choice-of-anchor L domain-containing protein [Pseudorhodobacter sp. E13]RUS58945.1 2,3,4,5-tetrahydropyridine-2,6-carboxylate N-succinyltransferase [Pseudorhodobacter sp. E13]
MVAAAELAIDTSASALDMANAMFGAGVTILSANYSGAAAASGIYSGGLATAPGVVPSDSGVILSTGRATDFTNSTGQANQAANTSGNLGRAGDAQLSAIAGVNTFDAAIFTASFVPDGNVLTMQITFSSEEYLEYVNSGFNDATAIWVNGVQAELTVGTGDITINNINTTSNSNLFVNNPAATSPFNTEMDGFTVTLTLKAPVIAGATNTIKIAIADGGDRIYDSNLLIAGDSIQVALIAGDDEFDIGKNDPVTYDLLANDTSSTGSTLTITQINGQPVVAGSVVTLATGEQITVNGDGTITVLSDGSFDSNTFTYTVADADGNTDVAFVTVNTVPCFTRSTRIRTARGDIAVEDLAVGDRVITRDHGLQPIRWIGARKVAGIGPFAPVVFEAGSLGAHDRLVLSQQHCVLMRGASAQMTCGAAEVLVRAKHLINGHSIRLETSGAPVEYFHILCDRHEILWSNGLETESFHPGTQVLNGMEAEKRAEVLALFPELAQGDCALPTARPEVKAYEAQLLGQNIAA